MVPAAVQNYITVAAVMDSANGSRPCTMLRTDGLDPPRIVQGQLTLRGTIHQNERKHIARHVSDRHRSSNEKWRSEVLAANCRNTSGSETHCRRARLPSPGERHSAGLCEASSPRVDLLDGET